MKRLLLCITLLSIPIMAQATPPPPVHELCQTLVAATPMPSLHVLSISQVAAAPAPASAPSIGSKLVDFALSHWEYLLTALLSLPFVASHLSDKRKRVIATALYYGAHMAADADAEMAPGGAKSTVDKIAAYAAQADAYLLAHGWRALKPGESGIVETNVKALVGKAKSSGDASPTPAPIPSP